MGSISSHRDIRRRPFFAREFALWETKLERQVGSKLKQISSDRIESVLHTRELSLGFKVCGDLD